MTRKHAVLALDVGASPAPPEASAWATAVRPGSPAAVDRATVPALRLLPAPALEPPYDDDVDAGPHLRLVRPHAAPAAPRTPLPTAAPTRGPRRPALPEQDPAPSAGPAARALVHLLLEVLGGERPVRQLQRGTTPAVFAGLERTVRWRPATGRRPRGGAVRSVHVQQRAGIAEVCATVRRGERLGALALRLELQHGAWICTQLQGL